MPQNECGLVGMGFNPSIYPLREDFRRQAVVYPRHKIVVLFLEINPRGDAALKPA